MTVFGFSMEALLATGYAAFLAMVAFVLEVMARHMHRRSLRISHVGFTYHADRDIWICPRDQHLFPIFSDATRGKVIYQAPASACNSCPSKLACTDSSTGREIVKVANESIESGMLRFHRWFSLTLLLLASVIMIIELFRASGSTQRLFLAGILLILFVAGRQVFSTVGVGLVNAPPNAREPG